MTQPQKPPESPIVVAAQGEPEASEAVGHPAKLLRIASMVRELLEEARQSALDEGGRRRLQTVYERSLGELKEVLSENLQRELDALAVPISEQPTESELRVAQAQLVGWLEGLFHGIQAALWAQQAMARAQFEEVRRRGLPSQAIPSTERPERPAGPPGQYL